MTVAEVRAYFAAGGARLANVRIAALVDCADLRTANGHSYAVGATQGSDDWPLVLVALNGAARCEVVARDPFGDVERGDPALWREAGVPRETPVLRPANLHLAGFVVFCVGAGFGFLLIVDGLRTRRAEAEQLRRLLAEPVLPSASAQRRVFTLKTPEGCVFEEVFDHGALPFYLEPFGVHVLALRAASDPSRVVVLRDDLFPIEADADEPARVRGRHRQRSPTRTDAPRRPRRRMGAARLPRRRSQERAFGMVNSSASEFAAPVAYLAR